ncbi:MAG TPA: endonuclease, partial [Aequorivita sp.]|nr:endonuclease [Aequorivita sp.]
MNFSEIIITIFSVLMLVPTLASLCKCDHWWIRGFDFPRLQISSLILLVLLCAFFTLDFERSFHYILVSLLIASFIYQAVKIYPYTIFAKKQVLRFKGNDPNNLISILVSNVLAPNKHYDKLIAHVKQRKPDLLLTLETDKVWEKALAVI